MLNCITSYRIDTIIQGFSRKNIVYQSTVAYTSKNNDLLNAKNRIWTEGMPNPYTWDAQTFSGFYYNLDDNVSYETLTITLSGADNRTVKKGELIYTTNHKSDSNEFNFEDWGRYEVIGFMAEKYFAGYNKDKSEVISKDKSMVSKGQLSKILIDSDAEYTISVGDSLDLQDGYKLKMVQIDLNGNKVQFALYKNGNKVDTAIITGIAFAYLKINRNFEGSYRFRISDFGFRIDNPHSAFRIPQSKGVCIKLYNYLRVN